MAELLASLQDFKERHTGADDLVEGLLADASSLIRSAVRGSDAAWVSGDAEAPDEVIATCVQVAYRAWSNPDALSSEALGAHTQAWADRSGEALHLTKAERRTVRGAAGLGSARAVTLVTPYSGEATDNDLLE
jgi:hypothetical protein